MLKLLLSTVLLLILLSAPQARATDPTPTPTDSEKKADHVRQENYKAHFMAGKTPQRPTFICAFCGTKNKTGGICPNCGMEMTIEKPEAKAPKPKAKKETA